MGGQTGSWMGGHISILANPRRNRKKVECVGNRIHLQNNSHPSPFCSIVFPTMTSNAQLFPAISLNAWYFMMDLRHAIKCARLLLMAPFPQGNGAKTREYMGNQWTNEAIPNRMADQAEANALI